MTLILASSSKTRRAMLEAAGVPVEIRVPGVDEDAIKAEGAPPAETAMRLAGMKAARVSMRAPGALVIGADQMLVCEGSAFDKPPDLAAARTQLLRLRGRPHELLTACVCVRDGAEVWRHLARPKLAMRDFPESFLDEYIAAEGEALLGSVGAYRLEGRGAQLFASVEGDFFSILGLPLLALLGFLRQTGALESGALAG